MIYITFFVLSKKFVFFVDAKTFLKNEEDEENEELKNQINKTN